MKKMRKIIPALAMLLVSAIMMSTASFAWFTMNEAVTATGVKVQAKSSGGLVIAVSPNYNSAPAQPTDYASSVQFTIGNATGDKSYDNQGATTDPKIAPVSHGLSGTTKGWYTATSADPSAFAAAGDYTVVNFDAATAGSAKDYFLFTQCYVRTLDESDGKLYLDAITVTGDNVNANLDLTLRVAINVGDAWFYFAPTRTAAPAASEGREGFYCANIVSGDNNDTAVAMPVNVPTSITDNRAEFTNVELGTLAAAGATQEATIVNIYIYFDGEDPQCKSVNVKTLVDMNVSFEFSSVSND